MEFIVTFIVTNMAAISLIALVVAIVLSVVLDINLGTMALGIAFILAVVIGNWTPGALMAEFPINLFLLLSGVMFFFAIANTNGTLEKVCKYAVKSVRGNVALLPIMLFFLAFILASIGPGQIAVAALLAAPVMALAVETKTPLLLMTLVVGNGANAGAMSPIAPSGLVGYGIISGMGWGEGALAGFAAPDWSMALYINMLIVHVVLAVGCYFLFGGLKLLRRVKERSSDVQALRSVEVEPFTIQQKITLIALLIFIVLVIFVGWHLGFTGFLLGSLLIIFKIGDEKKAIKAMPWNAILLVTGVVVLVGLMQDIGGIDLFADIMAVQSNPTTVTLIAGFWSGVVSAYASTSGVILPAFLPMAPLLLERIGASMDDLLALISSIIVAGHLTDLSPLSTTGAVFISGCPDSVDRKPLYRGMIFYAFGMMVVGALLVWVLFGLLRINV